MPVCYLKNFQSGDKLFTLDIRKVQIGYNEKPKWNKPGKICYFPNYYTIAKEMDNSSFNLIDYDELYIEKQVLAKLENRYGGIFEMLVGQEELTREQAIDLIDFVIQIKLRNPYWLKETLEKNKDEMIDSAMKDMYEKNSGENPLFAHIPMEIRKMVLDKVKEDNKSNPDFSKQMQLFGLVSRYSDTSERNKLFRKILVDCDWIIFEAPVEGPYFITSDNPGYTKKDDNLTYNTNFSDQFMFFFPLSPKYCLVIANDQRDNCYSENKPKKIITIDKTTSDMVITINNNSMQCINKLLIAMDDWYLSQIAALNNPKKQ